MKKRKEIIKAYEPGASMSVELDKTMDAIRMFVRMYGYVPSIRELCGEMGISSTSSIHNRLHRLEEMGRLELVGPRQVIRLTRELMDEPAY